MTTEYTNKLLFSPSTPMTNSFSSNPSTPADAAAFSSALDNASKSYADKSENVKAYDKTKNNESAQKTKDVKTAKTDESKSKETVNGKNSENKVPDEKPVKTEQNKESAKKEEACATTDNKKTENKKEVQDKTDTSDAPKTNDLQTQTAAQQSALQQAAAELKADVSNIAISDNPDDTAGDDVLNSTVQKNVKQNVIANEQILANIEYTDTSDIEAAIKEQIPDIDEKALKAIVEEAKKAAAPNTSETSKTAQADLSLENLTANKDSAAKPTAESDTQISAKTTKENLASDISRLTANLEQAAEEPDVESAKALTPIDTEPDKTPVIKVTQEVAEAAKENSTAGIENKDVASKAKDKAVKQMTDLQETNTVVTKSETTDTSSSSQKQDSLSQNGAGEQAAKLSVDDGAVSTNNQVNAADTFASRLSSQIASKASANTTQTLSQSDIMSQVNAKFEQMQQTGTNKVSIVLQPENLGRVSVEIMNTKDGVVAKMLTDNQQVKDLFDKNIESLKNNLSSQGVNVNNIKVECAHQSSNNAMNSERDQFNQSFDNPQNSQHNQAHHSNTASQNFYGTENGEFDEGEFENINNAEIKNTDTIIKHNGKVDYTV